MSKNLNQTIKRYNELRPQIGNQIVAPRLGYYLIQEVFPNPKFQTLYCAKALWKENAEDSFFTRVIHDIQLTAFVMTQPQPEKFNPEIMEGRVIAVTHTSNSEFEVNGKMYPTVACLWDFCDDPYLLDDSMPKLFDLLEDVSLTDLVNSYEDSLETDTKNALEFDEREQLVMMYGDDSIYDNQNDALDAENGSDSYIDFNGNEKDNGSSEEDVVEV